MNKRGGKERAAGGGHAPGLGIHIDERRGDAYVNAVAQAAVGGAARQAVRARPHLRLLRVAAVRVTAAVHVARARLQIAHTSAVKFCARAAREGGGGGVGCEGGSGGRRAKGMVTYLLESTQLQPGGGDSRDVGEVATVLIVDQGGL